MYESSVQDLTNKILKYFLFCGREWVDSSNR